MSEADDFEQAVHAFIRSISPWEEVSEEEFEAGTRLLMRVFGRAWDLIRTGSHVRDTFSAPKLELFPMHHALYAVAEKIGSPFRLGINDEAIFLSATLMYPRHLSRVDDDFFNLFFELGAWKFDSPRFEVKAKSELYRLIAATREGEDLTDFGDVVVQWSPRISWEEYLARATKTLAVLHQINYQLYRVEYQQRAGRASSKRRTQREREN